MAKPAPIDTEPSEIDALKATVETQGKQIAELLRAIQEQRQAGQERVKAVEAPKKFAAWEEEIWVEAMQDCVYPDPPKGEENEIEYGIYRVGRKQDTDERGNPVIVSGAVFLLKHREHLNKNLREMKQNEIDAQPVPVRHIPQTTARAQRARQPGR
jgi:hypothetical protein